MSSTRGSAELLSLAGKTALVTGGAGGIGSAVVRRLLESGAAVASVDLRPQPNPDCLALECDLSDPSAVTDLFESLRQRFERLDILVHCAGITRDAVLWKMETEAWSQVLRVNLDSAFLVIRQAIPLMRERGAGSIVFVSSINGERGKFGQANYAASKAGLIGLARTAARELGRFGIRVNVIAPGMIETPLTKELPQAVVEAAARETTLGRIGQPDDVARVALFLVSPMATHMTGQVLRVDGGQLIA